MAMIIEKSSGRRRVLEAEHLVGRGPTSGLVIGERYVSARHAILRFVGDRWELRDLGSRNGTFLDGVRVRPGEEYPLSKGATVAFGKVEQEWTLVDDAAPWAMAVPLDGGEPVGLQEDLLALPSTEDPRATIYRNPDGVWVLEQPDSIAPVTNLETFEVAGRAFRFSCPENIAKTTLADSSSEIEVRHMTLLFSVSRDEEHVELRATCGARSFELGTRLHNYLLLTLARRRLADAAEGLPETSCGWIYQEDFPNDPSMEPQRLNLDVLRIRQQFAALGVSDAANIVERRPRTRQLRIGVNRLSVVVL
jgi:hypothetical protein